ncbi:glyceraldehyde-3-phosphate dehydrogenase [Reichenbachiella sp. 5M10]|uniref:glyceraldehyde-3-phosphate dehydrogenase n=1 Tax=Reichenbachiella sp. 5M10 TaxID=1889772 RepID=UPI000C14DED1|nr:glyceraldehyde-3-phosphate dehydrogenase [Reichenbachiella sp. 5M10]PIB35425.1 glyceraldehyde-3-phosphate dehydrogenase [Reichenbachiella sp. 5M10]
MKYKILLLFWLTQNLVSVAQDDHAETKEKMSLKVLKDSLDGKIDMSDFLIDYHGFIPVPQIITEPALGNIGVMFTPIFIAPNKHQVEGKYTPPNITAAFVGYSANKSWAFGGMRVASLPQHHLKYRVGAMYGDVNMDFYRNLPVLGDREFSFNMDMLGAYGALLRQVAETDLYMGVEYFYLHNDVHPEFNQTPDFIKNAIDPHSISNVGITLDFDKRDNVFTPDKGLYVTSDYRVSEPWTGSDFSFQNFHIGIFEFIQPTKNWVSGFRFEGAMQFGDAPFYMKPSINLRGVPKARYQGDQTYVLETEQRYDLTLRWSVVAFGGLAKAPTKEESFADVELVHNYGTGFRYLMARKFKLRAGVDIAKSNDDIGWYIVIGSFWNDRN